MPDTYTATLNLVKPAAGSLDWAPKVNGNQDIIDTMGNRITALEGVLGGAVAGVTRIPSGATWPAVVTAFNNAPDNPAARHLILLPNEPMEQTAAIHWYKHVDLRGSGSASELYLTSNVSIFGASDAFIIGATVNFPMNGLIFSDFKYSNDRVSGGAGMRNNPFSIGDYTENVMLKNIDFADITANGIQILSNNAGPLKNIFVLYCTMDEFYEAAIILDGMNMDGVYLIKNTGVTSAASPLGGVSRPQGIFIGNEQAAGSPLRFGTIENLICAKNQFDFRPMGGGNGQTLGITMATGNQTGAVGVRSNWRYNNITLDDNKVYGAEISYRVQGTRDQAYGSALIVDYELDEPSASTSYLDSHYFYNSHLTPSGGPTRIAGVLGNATHFTRASSQYLKHAHNAIYNGTFDNVPGTGVTILPTNPGIGFGINASVKMDSKPAGPMVVASKWDTTGNQRGWILWWDNVTDRFMFSVSVDGTAVFTASCGVHATNPALTAPSLATPYYLFGTLATHTGVMNLSVNGGTPGIANPTIDAPSFVNTAEFRIGADMQGRYWDGTIEKVRMFYYAVTTQIVDLYNSGAYFTYTDLDYQGGRCNITITNNLSDGATNAPLVLEQGQTDYFQLSNNTFKSPGGGNYGATGAEIIAQGKPNKIVIG